MKCKDKPHNLGEAICITCSQLRIDIQKKNP